uniref:HAAS signaling domain-containing protein n=2 Tax=Brevundimonas TaxID=41275 RepID=UPI0039184B0C
MDLVERYLNALAAQLPKAVREDIVAELRDEIIGRLEALEARLGRPATDDEVEGLLREVGHPLSVAARYRPGPQALIGPTLYPWWLFGAKVGLVVMAGFTLVGLAVRVLVGDIYVGQAVGQAFASLFSGAVTVVGLLTIAGFILERQEKKPDFIAQWRV